MNERSIFTSARPTFLESWLDFFVLVGFFIPGIYLVLAARLNLYIYGSFMTVTAKRWFFFYPLLYACAGIIPPPECTVSSISHCGQSHLLMLPIF
jgi:hypothetical protein